MTMASAPYPKKKYEKIKSKKAARAAAEDNVGFTEQPSKWDIVRGFLTPEAKAELAKKKQQSTSTALDSVMPEMLRQIREARNKGQKNRVLRLIKKMDENFDDYADKLLTELYLFSHALFDYFTPSSSPKYPIFTAAFLVANVAVFTAMAAEYPWYQTQVAGVTLPSNFIYSVGPPGLTNFCSYNNKYYTFSGRFLRLWGGRYGPAIEKGDDYRWFTSLLVHSSFQHIFSNMLLFVALAAPLVRW